MPNIYIAKLNATKELGLGFREPELIKALYGSLAAREGFHHFLELLSQSVSAHAAELVVVRKQPLQIDHIWYAGLPDDCIHWYTHNTMSANDIVSNPATFQAPGNFHSAVALLETMDVSEDYKRWQADQNMIDTAWLVVHTNPTHTTLLTIQRTVEQGVYHADELRQLNQLTPFIRQAVLLYEQVAERSNIAKSLAGVINAIPDATFVLNDQAAILYANSAAKELVAREQCLSITDQRLEFDEKPLQHAFLQSSVKVARASMGICPYHADTLFLRGAKREPLIMVIRPIENAEHAAGGALVTVFEPSNRPLPTADKIAGYFSLSPSEAALCEDLVTGMSLKEIAERRHKTEATLRSYLKQVFQKTAHRRQGELISSILCALL
jgi:DNA-binding CsgD family transcriptional regulator